jgi:hypothetical protein
MTTMQIAHIFLRVNERQRELRTEEITEIAGACGDSQWTRNNEGH